MLDQTEMTYLTLCRSKPARAEELVARRFGNPLLVDYWKGDFRGSFTEEFLEVVERILDR